MNQRIFLFSVSAGAMLASSALQAQTPDNTAAAQGDEIVVTGTRVVGRARLDTVSPVDVLSGEALRSQGTTELGQALSTIAPSIDFPRSAAVDVTDSVRPATLRGLSPDQTLVLINGIRGHSSALLNTNGSVGRGAASFDLNTIPTVALDRVEVLRDGASAQYGSDAIAGVINLRLREARSGGGSTVSYGQYDTRVEPARSSRTAHDGKTVNASAWQGFGIGQDGFLTVSADYLNRNPTSRGDIDIRRAPNVVRSRFGDPHLQQYTLFANFGVPVNDNWQFYGYGGYQHRDSTGAALPRVPGAGNASADAVTSVYPNGFLPLIRTRSEDINSALGLRGDLGDWKVDANISYGRNQLQFRTRNSINASYLGAVTQSDFYSGMLTYDQLTGGVDVTRKLDLGSDNSLNVAFGAEGRREGFKIGAGEPLSYNRGPAVSTSIGSGAQGFPGFRPSDASSNHRGNVGAYVDLEAQLTKLTLGAAGRYEHYSDFGSNGTGKLSARYDFMPAFALRATASTGFRAPSLQQSYYSFTQSGAVNGVLLDIRTFPSTSAPAVALGGKALKPEKSTNLSAGAVVRAGGFDFTLDAYRIHVRDQLALSENLLASNPAVAPILAPFGVGGARFFLNGISSTAKGIDAVAHYRLHTDTIGQFDFTAAGNYNHVDVTKVPTASGALAGVTLFGQQRITSLERGTPRTKDSLTADWSLKQFGATARATYYGSVIEPAPNVVDYVHTGQHTIIDLEGRVKLFDVATLALGVNNLFDVYPDRVATTNGNNYNAGATAYPYYSPFGFNGRFLYARVSVNW